jgi:hypothetical protein
MAGITIGSVSVAVVPSLAAGDFFEKIRVKVLPEADKLGIDMGDRIRTGIDSSLKDITVTVTVKLDTAAAQADLDKFGLKTEDLKVKANTAEAVAALDAIKLKADDIGRKTETITVKINDSGTTVSSKIANAGKAAVPGGQGGGGSSGLAAAGLTAPLSNPFVLAGAATAAIAALPFAAQVAAGGIVTALGGAFAAVGVIGAARTQVIKNNFAELRVVASRTLSDISAPFIKVVQDILFTADVAMTELALPVGNAIKALAVPFDNFVTTLTMAFTSPAVALSIERVGVAFGDILNSLSPQLPGDINNIALGITRVANAIASDPKAFADFISFLLDSVGFALSMISALTRAATWIEGHWSIIDLALPFTVGLSAIIGTITHIQGVINTGLLVVDGYFNNFLAHGISWGVSYLHVIADAFGWIPGIGSKVHAFVNAGVSDLLSLGTATTQYGSVATRTANGAVKTFITSLNQMGLGSKTTTTDVNLLATAVQNQGSKSDAARNARATLIADLVKSGVNAKTARTEVDNFVTAMTKIPANKNTSFGVSVKPSTFKISEIAGSVDDPIGELHLSAKGSRVPGYGGGDKHLYLLEGGEAVIDKVTTAKNAATLAAWGVPGFAAGGLAGLASATAAGNAKFGTTWGSAVQKDTQAAIAADIRAALNADSAKMRSAAAAAAAGGAGVAGPGGGNALLNAMLARSMMPAWANGAQWAAWDALEMSEAGWNQFARNPSSGAYGIPQALPPSKMGAAANPPQSNPHAQISWMIGYIKSRYGTPVNAEAHERAFHWYDEGGYLAPGGFGFNGLNRPEPVLTPSEGDWLKSAAGAGASGKTEKLLERIASAAERAPAETAGHIGGALNNTARLAGARGAHQPRRSWNG